MKNYLFCTGILCCLRCQRSICSWCWYKRRREKRVTESSIINGLRSGRREPMMYAASVAGRFVKGNPQSAIKIYKALVNAIDDTRISCCCKPPLEEIEEQYANRSWKDKDNECLYFLYIRSMLFILLERLLLHLQRAEMLL